jgi:hypothetical protein
MAFISAGAALEKNLPSIYAYCIILTADRSQPMTDEAAFKISNLTVAKLASV